jgi:hypothetical protein
MSDEELKTEETVEETPEEIQEETPQETPEDTKKSIIERAKEAVFGKKEEQETEEIPDYFTEAAKAAGFEDEAEIKKLAGDMDEEQLKEFAAALVSDEEEEVEEEEPEEVEEEKIEDVDENKLQAAVAKIQKDLEAKYSERLAALEEHLKAGENERAIKEEISRVEEADSFFDRVSEKLPVFGKTEKLMRFPAGHKREGEVIPFGKDFEARNSVWQAAHMFYKSGYSWKDSLTEALDWYKGKNLETDVRDEVVKDLKKNEKRLSAKRTSAQVSKTPQSEDEVKANIIEEAKRRAGIA